MAEIIPLRTATVTLTDQAGHDLSMILNYETNEVSVVHDPDLVKQHVPALLTVIGEHIIEHARDWERTMSYRQ